jgi:hypothetical protein
MPCIGEDAAVLLLSVMSSRAGTGSDSLAFVSLPREIPSPDGASPLSFHSERQPKLSHNLLTRSARQLAAWFRSGGSAKSASPEQSNCLRRRFSRSVATAYAMRNGRKPPRAELAGDDRASKPFSRARMRSRELSKRPLHQAIGT